MNERQFRYAVHYFHYGAQEVDYGDDLRELVRMAEYAEDDGRQSTAGFYEMVGDEWHQLDVTDIVQEVRSEIDDDYKSSVDREADKPYRVYIFGPNNVDNWWSSHHTEAEAQEVAATMPAALRATVTTDRMRPWRYAGQLGDITVPLAEIASRLGE